MNKEYALGCSLFVVIFMAVCVVYIRSIRYQFTLDNALFEQAGVMEYHDGDNTLYIPVFRKLRLP